MTRRHPRFLDVRLTRCGGWLSVWGFSLMVAHVGSPTEAARAEWARHYRPNRFALYFRGWALGLGEQGFRPNLPRGWSWETPWLLDSRPVYGKVELTARRLRVDLVSRNELNPFAGFSWPNAPAEAAAP